MTSLTDKMETLRKDTPNEFDIGSERSTPKIIRDNGFNYGVDAAIDLVKAEAAVVGDWEVEFEKQFVESDEDGDRIYEPGDVNSIKTFITNLLTAKDREIK